MAFYINKFQFKNKNTNNARRKKFRFGLVFKSVFLLFVLSSIIVIVFVYKDYGLRKKIISQGKKKSLYIF